MGPTPPPPIKAVMGSLAVGLTAESKSFEKTSRGGIIRIIIDGWLKEIFTKSFPSFASSGSATAGIESICYCDVTFRTSEPPLGLHLLSVCVCKFGNLLVIKVRRVVMYLGNRALVDNLT